MNNILKNYGKKVFSFLLVFLLILTSACGPEQVEKDKKKKDKPVKMVNSLEVSTRNFVSIFEVSGTIKPKNETTLASEVGGTVDNILLKEGDIIKEGDLLLKFSSQNNVALRNYESAKVAFENAERLLELTIDSTKNSRRSVQLGVEQAQISLDVARKISASTDVSIDEQVKSTETTIETTKMSVTQAKNNLEDTRENLNKQEKNIISSTVNVYRSSVVDFEDVLRACDNILGASEAERQANDDFETWLMAGNSSLFEELKHIFIMTNAKFLKFKEEIKMLNEVEDIIELQKLMKTEEMSFVILIDEIRTLVDMVDKLIGDAVINEYFLQSTADTLRSTVVVHKGKLELILSSFTSLENDISDFIIKKPQTIGSLELVVKVSDSQLNQVEHSLTNLKASLDIQDLTTSSQITIQQKSLEAAKIKLDDIAKSNAVQTQNATASRDSAMKSLESAQSQLSKLTVKSPIAGTITKIFPTIGDTIGMGSALFVISETDFLLLEGDLAPEEAVQVAIGQKMEVMVNNETMLKNGKISHISPLADERTRRVRVEIEIANDKRDVFPNTFATAKIEGKIRKNILSVPLSVLMSKDPVSVYMIDTNQEVDLVDLPFFDLGPVKYSNYNLTEKEEIEIDASLPFYDVDLIKVKVNAFDVVVEKVKIEIGEQSGYYVEVLDGLKKGDLIVKEKVLGLEDGDKIQVVVNNRFSGVKLPTKKKVFNDDNKDLGVFGGMVQNQNSQNGHNLLNDIGDKKNSSDKVNFFKDNEKLKDESSKNLKDQKNLLGVDKKISSKVIDKNLNQTLQVKDVKKNNVLKNEIKGNKVVKKLLDEKKEVKKLPVLGVSEEWILKPTRKDTYKTSAKKFEISGKFPKGTTSVQAGGFYLRKFNPKVGEWKYNVSVGFGNLRRGDNLYIVKFRDKFGKILAEDRLVVKF